MNKCGAIPLITCVFQHSGQYSSFLVTRYVFRQSNPSRFERLYQFMVCQSQLTWMRETTDTGKVPFKLQKIQNIETYNNKHTLEDKRNRVCGICFINDNEKSKII